MKWFRGMLSYSEIRKLTEKHEKMRINARITIINNELAVKHKREEIKANKFDELLKMSLSPSTHKLTTH